MGQRIERAPEIKRARIALARATDAGVFEGYASLFGVVDSANDEVVRGAFADSLRARSAAGVKMLWQHKACEPIGSWLSIEEDARGLKVVGQLNLAVARAREVLALLREGAVDGLSIGFRALRAGLDRNSGVRKLYRIDLWEISVVTFPALAQARISMVKAGSLRPPAERAAAALDALCLTLARLRAQEAAAGFEFKLRRLIELRCSPDQPRVPAGSSEGGRWAGGDGEGGGGNRPSNPLNFFDILSPFE